MKWILIIFFPLVLNAEHVQLGIDRFFQEEYAASLKGKRVGLITNHTGVDRKLKRTIDLFHEHKEFKFAAIFTPEHGLNGEARKGEHVENGKTLIHGVPVFSLHGQTRRPTKEMLKKVDVLVFDIQEIGCRSYTYASTLFYAMEEAAKARLPVIVLDRPNPMNGIVVDGPMLKDEWRSFLGYINVPYCHGMTIGELARFFNAEYKINCQLTVVPMRGWKRSMTFKETGLPWIPTSPYIPEPDTPFYYASTGILGAIGIVNIGIGYTLPFKVIGAPWIDREKFAAKLNGQKLPGVTFLPFSYRPFYGLCKEQECHGVKIVITDHNLYKPLLVQYMLIGMLKTLYPQKFKERLSHLTLAEKESFCKINGNADILNIMQNDPYIGWKLGAHDAEERKTFLEKRKKYLLY